ncbi:transposase [Pseudohaliea sp.]|uniref:transposase n=1 Tax=Pseudohaliea sp. TaxID=2740289 RepID=UPI0032EECDED
MLGLDEHFFTRKRGYATTLVDLRRNKVFDARLGRSEASLDGYLRQLPGKDNVRLIVMDLSETYRNIARQYFPRATIVADRFHVVRLVNQHFLKAWQAVHPEGRKNRGLLSLMRRHEWRLRPEQRDNLQRYLADYTGLGVGQVAATPLSPVFARRDRGPGRPIQQSKPANLIATVGYGPTSALSNRARIAA